MSHTKEKTTEVAEGAFVVQDKVFSCRFCDETFRTENGLKIHQSRLHKQQLNSGRPTVITDEVLRKLEEAFAWGCTDAEACLHAEISPGSLYSYQKQNPKFLKRKQELKENPILLARKTVIEHITDNYGNAMDFLSRKKKDEFSQRSENVNVNVSVTKLLGNDRLKRIAERVTAGHRGNGEDDSATESD